MITGSLVALVSPMFEDGSLDYETLRQLIDWHIEQGTNAIVAVGTTGESPTVDMEEHGELIRVCVEQASGRVPVIAGTGGNSTTEAIELTEHARQVGAAASLQVVPYYNKPSQEGMYQHFQKVAQAVDLPMMLYNVPGRTVADLAHDTVLRLSRIDNIIGIKDATGDMARGAQLIRDLPNNFAVYSGDDPTAVHLMLMGGKGNVSVTANVAPKYMSQLCRFAIEGNSQAAHALNLKLFDLHQAMFLQANPIPVKYALARMNKIPPGLRLPLTQLDSGFHDQVDLSLKRHELLTH